MNHPTGSHAITEVKLAIAAPPSVDVMEFLQEIRLHWPRCQVRDYTIGALDALCLETYIRLSATTSQEARVFLRGLSGHLHYHAMQEVLLSHADGILVLLDMQPSQRNASMQILLQTTQAMRQQGLDIHQIPMVLLYLRADLVSVETIAEWDQLLEWERNEIPRYLSTTKQGDDSAHAIDTLLQRVLTMPRLSVS